MRQLIFNSLTIKRAIIHKILERKETAACSLVDESDEIIDFNPKMTLTLIERLLDAMGRKGKGFYLEIGDVSSDSYYKLCDNLNKKSDNDFVSTSKELATKLAGLQRKGNIPDSYLMFIEAIDESYHNKPVYITIKAEPHSAFKRTGKSIEILVVC